MTVHSNVDSFHFVPSNRWLAVGYRKRKDSSFALAPVLAILKAMGITKLEQKA